MADTRKLLAISGASNEKWEAEFEKNVVYRDGVPVRGSIGVHFDCNINLDNLLYETFKGDKARLRAELLKTLDIQKVNQLLEFYEFATNPSNTFFFIKKGITPKYLVSRVGYYRFDPTFPYCHRIAFEFVRLANNKENQPLVGLGVKTIASVNTTHGTVTELLG